jgi:hypothetical protein
MAPSGKHLAQGRGLRLAGVAAALAMALAVAAVGAGPVAASDGDGGTGARAVSVVATNPPKLNLFATAGFRYQDPNWYACTSTSVMDMLNFTAIAKTGGPGFSWTVKLGSAARDSILAWARAHDTLEGGNGSDPHGWRNALNYYGWGSGALGASTRVYDDRSFVSYDNAIKSVVRSLIRFRKPAGIVAWAGRHAQMITGYDGLVGNPFAKDSSGNYTNAFSVAALFVTDPLASQGMVNARISYNTLKSSSNAKVRFTPYLETDSPYDDPYTSGTKPARDEWYGKWVTIQAIR